MEVIPLESVLIANILCLFCVSSLLPKKQLYQVWKLTELAWIGAEYETEDGLVCYGESNTASGPVKSTFTAKCVNGMAKIDVLVWDECFLPETSTTPGLEMQSGLVMGGCEEQEGTLKATFNVPCSPGCGDEIEPLSLPAPTDSPTLSPTLAPTLSPTESPTPGPTECVPMTDIEQEGDFSGFNPAEDVLKILQQSPDGKTVTVQMSQSWKLTGKYKQFAPEWTFMNCNLKGQILTYNCCSTYFPKTNCRA